MSTIETSFRIIASVIGANTFRSLSESINNVSTGADGLRRSFANASTALKGFAAMQGVQMLGQLLGNTIKTATELNKLSQQTGLTAQTLAQFKGATEANGLSLDTVTDSIDSLSEKMIEAQDGTSEAGRAFKALGVNVLDSNGKLRSTQQIYPEMVNAFASIQDGAEKSAIAQALLGDSGAQLIPVFNEGMDYVKKYGQAMNDDLIQSSVELKKDWNELTTVTSGLGTSFASGLIPVLKDCANELWNNDDAGSSLRDSQSAWQTFGNVVGDVFRSLAIMALELKKAWIEASFVIDNSSQYKDLLAGKTKSFFSFGLFGGEQEERARLTLNGMGADSQRKVEGINQQISKIQDGSVLNRWWHDKDNKDNPQPKAVSPGRVTIGREVKFNPDGDAKAEAEAEKRKAKAKSDADKVAKDRQREAEKTARERQREMEIVDQWIFQKTQSNKMLAAEREEIGKTTYELEMMRAELQWKNEVEEKSRNLHGDALANFQKEEKILQSSMMKTLQNNLYAKGQQSIKEWVDSQKSAIQSFRDEREEIGKTSDEIERLRYAKEIDNEITKKSSEYNGILKEQFLDQAYAIKAVREEELKRTQQQRRSFTAGAKSFLSEYSDSINNTAENTYQAFDKAFSGAEDALVDFLNGGKSSFADFTKSILEDMQRIIIKQTLLAPFADFVKGNVGDSFGSTLGNIATSIFGSVAGSFAGTSMAGVSGGVDTSFTVGAGGSTPSFGVIDARPFANGGIMTNRGEIPLHRYARGGIANSPQLALFAEAGAEAYVPLPDGRSIPVTMRGSGSGGTINNVNVNISISSDKKSDDKQNMSANSEMGKMLGRMVSDTVKETLVKEQRPGGLLAK